MIFGCQSEFNSSEAYFSLAFLSSSPDMIGLAAS